MRSLIDGRYRIVEEIGRGGMGAVYKAVDARLGRVVALKVLAAHDIESKNRFLELKNRFFREANALRGLSHPNIVQIYDHGEAEGLLYLAMQYVEGRSLAQILSEGKHLDPEYTVEIIRQVGMALKAAHEHGIIHRDVKPSNILISKEGQVLLSDFGLARAIGEPTLTKMGKIAGTPAYMSPEHWMGKPLDAPSDLFSLGIVLYELLTGHRPFSGLGQTIMHNIVEKSPRSPREFNPNVTSPVEAIVLRSLAKDPNQRYQSANEFVHALVIASETSFFAQMKGQEFAVRRQAPTVVSSSAGDMFDDFAFGTGEMPARDSKHSYWKIGWIVGLLLAATLFLPGSTKGNTGMPNWLGLGLIVVLGTAYGLWILRRSYLNRAKPPTYNSPLESSPRARNQFSPALPGETTEVAERRTKKFHWGIQRRPTRSVFDEDDSIVTRSNANLVPYTQVIPSQEILKREPSALAWLVVLNGSLRGRQFRLTDNFSIGRQSDCDAMFDDFRISRRHAEISLEDNRFYITNHGRSGIHVNGVQVQRQELRDRDEIQIGGTIMLFINAVSAHTLTVEAKRRVREFDLLWEQLVDSARHE